MSLTRQLWLLLVITVLVALLGSVVVTVSAARSYLETELRVKNSDNAQALALSLSQQPADTAMAELAIAAQFDTGFYDRIRLVAPDGTLLVERRAQVRAPAVPAWFVRAAPIESVAGIAQVSDGWRPIGSLEVVSAASFAYEELWRGSLRAAGWLILVGVVAGAFGSLILGRIHAPLRATVAQAQALVDRRFVQVEEPRIPELQQLSRAMNTMVERMQRVFGEQGAQIDALRQQAENDPVTGLPHRSHFLARMASLQAREDAPPRGALLLLRLRPLSALNRDLGRAATDSLLATWAGTLGTWRAGSHDGLCGRLNGSDFALLALDADATGVATELRSRVESALAPWPQASVALAAVPWDEQSAVGTLMQAVDAALVRAEAEPGYSMVVETSSAAPDALAALGETEWRKRLLHALLRGTAALGHYPLLDRSGRLLHLEAPLRLRLQDAGAYEPAARWLPWAMRVGLHTDADLLAVQLALEAIERDGKPRGVNMASDSLGESTFVPRLREQLRVRPVAAAKLSLELGERAAIEHLGLLREMGRQIRPLGTKLGLEHAGPRLAQIDLLYEAGLDYVKLDASVSLDLAGERLRMEFVRSLVSMLHGLGIQVYAEGVRTAGDAEALWACGADGVTGPWVTAPSPPVAG